jgi:hypothetical protein
MISVKKVKPEIVSIYAVKAHRRSGGIAPLILNLCIR